MKKFLLWLGVLSSQIMDFFRKLYDAVAPNAKIAVQAVNLIKRAVENPQLNAIVLLTKSKADDEALAAAKDFIPKIAKYILDGEGVFSGGTRDELLTRLVDYIRGKTENGRIKYWADLAAQFLIAFEDGKLSMNEAITLTQAAFAELFGKKSK